MAQRADAEGVSRWLQAPVLVVTFMFGPLGLLMGAAVLAVRRRRAGVA
ncbi:MAG: abscisic acid-deficient protein Aba4 family protein [Rubrivivax sp.]